MRKIVALVATIGMLVVFGGMAFADGMCSYGSHATQAAVDKTDAAKPVAAKATEKADSDKLMLAQTEKINKPTSEPKK